MIAPLRDVMGHTGDDDSRLSCHEEMVAQDIRIMQ